ncbi:MAG: hypothetical protein ACHQD9_08385 [Chitinophagales bacterium]
MMIIIPILNAIFGWIIISSLFFFLFHPRQKRNFFMFEMQGFIPKNISSWGNSLGKYVQENFVNIPKMKDSLLQGESQKKIHEVLESRVDDFLRNKLKEKIPVFSMFITEGMISKMKEVLMSELESLVPSVIEQIAAGVEKQFNIQKMIDEKLSAVSMQEVEKLFYSQAGKGILTLKISAAATGLTLGVIELLIV